MNGLRAYLSYTDQLEFMEEIRSAYEEIGPMALSSFFAKLCYKSLVLGKNANVNRIRDVQDNLRNVIQTGHGSVLEHVWLNFVTTDCSRVFTHELVRHRVGTAFSQTSGRYCTVEDAELVLPPELPQNVCNQMQNLLDHLKDAVANARIALGLDQERDFVRKKRLTSALRRIMPNGATNEIGWSVNIRALRHMIEMRTSRDAEWEIRVVFEEVAELVTKRWPMLLHGGTCEMVDGHMEWKGLKV
jgi:thymidylate synthase (FAD)